MAAPRNSELLPFAGGVQAPHVTAASNSFVARGVNVGLARSGRPRRGPRSAGRSSRGSHRGASKRTTGHPLVGADRSLVAAIGATLIPIGTKQGADVVLSWEERPVVAVRIGLEDALHAMIEMVEAEPGKATGGLGTRRKAGREAIEDVADVMGMSRITIYNYLTAMREQP